MLQCRCSADSKCLRHFCGILLWILLNNLLRIDITKPKNIARDRLMAELEKAACDIETLELTSKWAELFLPLLGTLLKN